MRRLRRESRQLIPTMCETVLSSLGLHDWPHTLHASIFAYQHTCTPYILLLRAIRTRASGRQPPHTRSGNRVCCMRRQCCGRHQRCKLQMNAANYSPLTRPSLRWGHLNKRVGGLVLVQRGLRCCRRFHSDERTVPTVVGCRIRSRPYDNHADDEELKTTNVARRFYPWTSIQAQPRPSPLSSPTRPPRGPRRASLVLVNTGVRQGG
jgi:hypothetical protein